MARGKRKGRVIPLLDPDDFYTELHEYAEIIRDKSLSEETEDRLLLKIDEWIAEYHDLWCKDED